MSTHYQLHICRSSPTGWIAVQMVVPAVQIAQITAQYFPVIEPDNWSSIKPSVEEKYVYYLLGSVRLQLNPEIHRIRTHPLTGLASSSHGFYVIMDWFVYHLRSMLWFRIPIESERCGSEKPAANKWTIPVITGIYGGLQKKSCTFISAENIRYPISWF